MRKTFQLATVSAIPQEILKQMLQGMDRSIHTPVNNLFYFPLQGA